MMTDYKYYEASRHELRVKALWPILILIGLAALSFLLPPPGGSSLSDDYEGSAALAVMFSNSAKVIGVSLITLVVVAVIGSRRRLSSDYRLKEALAVIGAVIVFAGGGSLFNEHVLKGKFSEPRPNVNWLSSHAQASETNFSAESYYAQADLNRRSQAMKKTLNAIGDEVPKKVAQHWLSEPGYTFPSGHAFASYFVATFFLFFATSFIATRRQALFYLLLPWALCVAYSRVLLNVHRPVDITVGAIQGFVVGIMAWLLVRAIVRKLVQLEIGS